MSVSVFELTIDEQAIAWIKMDVPGEKMNTLQDTFAPQIATLLDRLSREKVKGAVLYSGKEDNFVAGADIRMLDKCTSEEEAQTIVKTGQTVFDRIASLPFHVVAAIHGPCLGGGLELAMACHSRICSDDAKTRLGLPEVQLGLLPGSGGTQRLPSLVGMVNALDMILSGKSLRAAQAYKTGLVDDCVPKSILLAVAAEMALQAKPTRKGSALDWAASKNPVGRSLLFAQAKSKLLAKTRGNYPAPDAILKVMKIGLQQGYKAGLAAEARHFGRLVMSEESKALRSIFFATTELKKHGASDTPAEPPKQVAVLGGGLMGGGISYVTAVKAGIPVRIKDVSEQGICHALAYNHRLLSKQCRRRQISKAERQKKQSLLSGSTHYCGFANSEVVIEAVFEDLSLKQQMVADIEAYCKEETIFASNTSSLPIARIAAYAARPENVIGLHYFSPVEKMPLVEIIPHATTSIETVHAIQALARQQGKTAIVVKDRAGFYVNRILTPYMNEAGYALLEGGGIAAIDNALLDYGFPLGPFSLLDEVGIDVGAKISPILANEFGERFHAPALFEQLLGADRKGRKSGQGFYRYKGRKKQLDKVVYSLLSIKEQQKIDAPAVAFRCVLMMLNEAARCLDEGVIASARDGDIGAIFGIGFPPFLGGPFRYMDRLGIVQVVEQLETHERQYGKRFTPCTLLLEMAQGGRSFY
ncbi:fatty acid oxidation complex subunit alpha FadJ [Thaumasiovibrio sp. DFM-14]|uniref:fatty acid oxidation complex subunit alpha FadJ n=1 Tax=Thaumasiovibrio sp. DFM-14 TaxID=3384792 RepID=UPI0039A28098